jgi:hypothetical protein
MFKQKKRQKGKTPEIDRPSPPFTEETIEKRISDLEIRQGILKELLELHTGRHIGADDELWKGL